SRCTLRARATELLTDPATNQINEQLRPLLDTWVASHDPRTQIRWLSHAPLSTELRERMARGGVPISHADFREVPAGQADYYLRNLLVAVEILDPCDARI